MIEKEILRSEWCKANSLENPEGIFLNLISLIKWDSAPTSSGYWPIDGEIDDLSFLEYCHNQGLQCSLPFVENSERPLKFKAWRPFDILEKGMYGIPAPSPQTSDLIPDVLLIPLLAFDRNCHRLGKGGGFYDRTLEKLRKTYTVFAIGLAYDQQEIDCVPKEEHDQKLDCIVTPTRIIIGN